GFSLMATLDHETNLWLIGVYTAIVGLGMGSMLQNVVLAVQNTVRLENIGAASSSVAFFRTFGGAIGVSVMGSVLATRVADLSTAGLAKLGITAGGGGSSLDIAALPAPVQEIVRASFGDATGRIFLIAAGCAVVAMIAVSLLPNRPLRHTLDIEPGEDRELVDA
ncbi:MAG: MFS transporter, partial [Aldersonia sp.]|nr:MFS transporter [Aldersonia sp.]